MTHAGANQASAVHSACVCTVRVDRVRGSESVCMWKCALTVHVDTRLCALDANKKTCRPKRKAEKHEPSDRPTLRRICTRDPELFLGQGPNRISLALITKLFFLFQWRLAVSHWRPVTCRQRRKHSTQLTESRRKYNTQYVC